MNMISVEGGGRGEGSVPWSKSSVKEIGWPTLFKTFFPMSHFSIFEDTNDYKIANVM